MPLSVQFPTYGTTEVLQIVDAPPLTAGPGQVRLRVHAAGVNPADWKIMQGLMRDQIPLHLPAGLGSDVAGVVDQVGADVTSFDVDDQVLGTPLTPAFAQSALADPAALVPKPDDLSWEIAASLPGAGGTAWTALEELGVAPGESLLVHAAAGGVGTFAVQLGIARGARVIGSASEHNHEQLRSFGAIPVAYGPGIAERIRAIAPQGVDAVLDASGRGEIPLSIELAGGPERVLTLVAFDAVDTGIRAHAGGAGSNGPRALRDILALIRDGRLRVPIWRTYGLKDAAAALDESRAGHLGGKIVLRI